MTVISLDDVSYAYNGVPVLDSVSLDVEPGAFLGLVGPNGSGKTTLMELAIGLRRPDAGSVTLFGESAHEFDEGRRIGYVAQDVVGTARQMPLTVREVVAMGRYPGRLVRPFTRPDRRAVDAALDRVDIADLAHRRAGRLSGGQRQRVFIARALAADAELLALDEPTVGIDADSREGFYALLHELHADGLTVVLIEHDIGAVTANVTEVACLNRELFFHGDPGSFVETGALAEAYGGDHYVVHHDH